MKVFCFGDVHMFQYHNGSIATVLELRVSGASYSFNTIMVRLQPQHESNEFLNIARVSIP